MTSFIAALPPVPLRFHIYDFVNGHFLSTRPNATYHLTCDSSCCFRGIFVNHPGICWFIGLWTSIFTLSTRYVWLPQLLLWSVAAEGEPRKPEHRTRLLACFDLDSMFLQNNACVLRTFSFVGNVMRLTRINPCGEIPALWTIHSLKGLWVLSCLHTCYDDAQTALPSRKFHLQFGPLSTLTTGCRDWWSPSCQSWLLARKTFTPLTELSDCWSLHQMSTHTDFFSHRLNWRAALQTHTQIYT